jgi:hypothetical protein
MKPPIRLARPQLSDVGTSMATLRFSLEGERYEGRETDFGVDQEWKSLFEVTKQDDAPSATFDGRMAILLTDLPVAEVEGRIEELQSRVAATNARYKDEVEPRRAKEREEAIRHAEEVKEVEAGLNQLLDKLFPNGTL